MLNFPASIEKCWRQSSRQRLVSSFQRLKPSRRTVYNSFQSHRSGIHSRPIVFAAADGNGASVPDTTPSSAETARTIVDLVAHGTLCTTGVDDVPLGTYATYVLDSIGQPILRLRADAVHTENLRRNPRCSLFVQPGEHPARLLARLTLVGTVEAVDAELAAEAADLHRRLHQGGVGVDAPQEADLYFRLLVEECFYVGGLSGASAAESVSREDYCSAEADPLRACAASLAEQWNNNRLEDVLRIAASATGSGFEDIATAELLWVDRLGAYIKATSVAGGHAGTFRIPFLRPVDDERDVRSTLTMLAQVAWEGERTYVPVFSPLPPPSPAPNS